MAVFHSRDEVEEKALIRTLEAEHDVHGFDDMPTGILWAFVASWAVLFSLFWLAFAWGRAAQFAVGVSTLFALVYFAVPAIMIGQAVPKSKARSGSIKICTGELSERAAATQVLLIPSALILAIGCMSIIKIIAMAG